MGASIILGFIAIRGGNVVRHQAWMTCAYALAIAEYVIRRPARSVQSPQQKMAV